MDLSESDENENFESKQSRPSFNNDNENENSSESGSEVSSSVDSSSDDGSKNEPASETNWSLLSFVKPDPKPVEKLPSLPVPQVKTESTGESEKNTGDVTSLKRKSPKCLNNDQIKKEPIGKIVLQKSHKMAKFATNLHK